MEAVIYTGGYGILPIKDEHGRRHPFYCSLENGNQMPVPKIFYKIVLFKSNESIVFVGVNCPATRDEIEADFIHCRNRITKWPWKDLKAKQWKTDLKWGYSYACSVEDFYESVLQKDGMIGIEQLPPISKIGLFQNVPDQFH